MHLHLPHFATLFSAMATTEASSSANAPRKRAPAIRACNKPVVSISQQTAFRNVFNINNLAKYSNLEFVGIDIPLTANPGWGNILVRASLSSAPFRLTEHDSFPDKIFVYSSTEYKPVCVKTYQPFFTGRLHVIARSSVAMSSSIPATHEHSSSESSSPPMESLRFLPPPCHLQQHAIPYPSGDGGKVDQMSISPPSEAPSLAAFLSATSTSSSSLPTRATTVKPKSAKVSGRAKKTTAAGTVEFNSGNDTPCADNVVGAANPTLEAPSTLPPKKRASSSKTAAMNPAKELQRRWNLDDDDDTMASPTKAALIPTLDDTVSRVPFHQIRGTGNGRKQRDGFMYFTEKQMRIILFLQRTNRTETLEKDPVMHAVLDICNACKVCLVEVGHDHQTLWIPISWIYLNRDWCVHLAARMKEPVPNNFEFHAHETPPDVY